MKRVRGQNLLSYMLFVTSKQRKVEIGKTQLQNVNSVSKEKHWKFVLRGIANYFPVDGKEGGVQWQMTKGHWVYSLYYST